MPVSALKGAEKVIMVSLKSATSDAKEVRSIVGWDVLIVMRAVAQVQQLWLYLLRWSRQT